MPKYKLSNGKYIFVEDTDVQDFLNSEIGQGAEEVQGPVATEQEVEIPGTNFDDYLKPAKIKDSASADPAVESENTGSNLVNGSLEQQEPKIIDNETEVKTRSVRGQVRQRELARRKQAIEQKKRDDLIAASAEAKQREEDEKNIDQTLIDAGSSVWSYSPENISKLYSKTTGEALDYQAIQNTSIIGPSSTSYTGIFNPYNSFLTGGFNYSDFADNEKIKGISISELQKADQANAASAALESIVKEHGDKSDDFVLSQGQVILKGKDKKLKELYSSLRTADGEDKQDILDQIKIVREDDSQELYDINSGNLVKYDKLPEQSKKDYNTIVEEADEKASTTELDQLKKELTNSYSNLVGISKRISSFVNENGEDEITKKSQTGTGYLVNLVKDVFGSEETTYGDLSRVQEIANTGVLPENVSKISGEHPLVNAYNEALKEYVILNRAVQTNTDPISEEQEGFWESAGDVLLEKLDITGGDATPKIKANANQVFVNSVEKAGLGRINQEEVDEAVSQNWKSVIGGGAMDLTLFVGEMALFRGATGNKIGKGFKWVEKAFKASKAAKSSKIFEKAGSFVLKGMDEAAVFTGLESTKTSLGLSQQATREQEWSTATFGFALGGGNSLGQGILRALPTKTIFSPITAQLSKSDVARNIGNRFVNANAGAFSFEFARASTAALSGDEEGFYDRNPEEFIKEYVYEVAKMGLSGAKSIFHKNGIYRAAQRDMRLLNLNPAYVNSAAKRTGINPESVRKPGEETINEIDAARAEKISGIDAKLKTEQITEDQAKKEIEAANKDYNILEAEAELNLAKERFEAENKSALKPTDESVRILIQKMKKGEKFNDKDNNALVNTPLPIIYDRMGLESSDKSLENRWNREFAIQDILNNNTSFKAPYGSKERADSYKFIDEAFEVGGQIKLLERIKDRNEAQEKELQKLKEDYKVYEPGGYKYDKLQDKLDNLYLKQRLANKAQVEDILSATQEGESVPVRSVEDFQKKYNSTRKDGQDVRSADGFYDPENKVFYINEQIVKATRNMTVDKHEAGHFILRESLKDKAGKITDDGIKVIDEVLSELTPKQRETVQKRIDRFYKYDKDGKERPAKDYYEEYLTVLSEAISEKNIVFKENVGNAFEKFLPFLRKKMPELELNADTGRNLFELIKSYSKGEEAGIEAAKKMSIAAEKAGASGETKTTKQTPLSKSVEDIQSEIVALEDLYDEQRIDYYEYESKMDVLEAKLEEARKAPKEKPKTTKAATKVNVSDIEEQIDALNNDFYDGIIDDIEHEQKLDILEAKLKQAKLQVSSPKEAKKQQEKIVEDSVEKFKKEVSEETISDKNKNIAKINEDIANEMLELGANKVADIKDPVKQKEIIDKLGRNNLGAVTNLTKKATAAGKDLAIDDNLKVGYDEFFSGFSEELSALIKSYKVEVDGKKVPFGAYMNKNLPLRYGQILDKALKGRIEGSKSLDVQSGEKGFAGTIAAEKSADFDAETSADRGLPAGELIDVTTFRKVKDKVEDIKESIDLTDVDVADLTYRKIQDDYSGDVGAEIIGLWDKNAAPEKGQDRNDFQKLAERIEGTRTLNYGKDTGGEAEVRAMQGLFLDYNDAVKFIKTIPEFNVAPFETTIDKQGRSIDLTEDARGYSTGISNKLLKKFYEPYIDPKATSKDKDVKKTAITSPSGRGKGKTSQVAKVYRLKPEYRGKISRQTVQELQKTIGITPAGEAFIPMKGPNRTEFGTALQGLTKMYATNVANTVIRKKIVEEGITSETKPTEKVLADIGGGKSRAMFSRSADVGLNTTFETPQLGNVLFSKKARREYESVLRNKRPDIENPKEQVEALIKWGDNLEGVPDNKKTKYKKLGLYYMANGFVIMPEDGYKVVEAIRLGDANKVDPYSVKNPNELIEKYQAKTKGVRINPDKVKEFSNKKVLKEGVTVYDVEDSRAGQLAVRKAIDTNWGFKANPWCLAAREKQVPKSTIEFYVTKEQAEAQKKIFEATGEYESVKIEKFNYNLGDGNTEPRFIVEAIRPLEKNFDQLSASFAMWESYNKKGNGFKIAFQNDKLLSFRDGNDLDWWDRQDKPYKGIKLKDKKLSENSVVEEYLNPETGEKEKGKTIKKFTEDGNAKVKEVYDIDGNLEQRTYKQEVEEDIFLSIDEKFNVEGDEIIVEAKNLVNDTRKNVTRILDKETGETKIITNVRGEKYYEFKRQIEKDGIVKTELETIISIADDKTIYNAEIYKGEFKVDVDNLKDTDFKYYTKLDEWFEDKIVTPETKSSDKALANIGIDGSSVLFSKRLQEPFKNPNKRKKLLKYASNAFEKARIKDMPEENIEQIKGLLNVDNIDKDVNFEGFFKAIMDTATADLSLKAKKQITLDFVDDVNRTEGKNIGSSIFNMLKNTRKVFKYEEERIGFGSSVDQLKTDINNASSQDVKEKLVLDWLETVSRSARTSQNKSLKYVSTNEKIVENIIKNVLEKDSSSFTVGRATLKNGKKVTYVKYKGEGFGPFTDITTIKKVGLEDLRSKMIEESNVALNITLNKIDRLRFELEKGNITQEEFDSQVDDFLSLVSLDQRGLIRKISKPGVEIIGYKGPLYLEHKMAAKEIVAELKKYSKDKKYLNKLIEVLDKRAVVNLMPKSLAKTLPNYASSIAKDSNYKNEDGYKTEKYLKALDKFTSNKNYQIKDAIGNDVLFSKSRLDTEFNKILENKTGILATDNISEVKAKMMANNKRKVNFFIPPSAEDFVGLLYATLGKGKVGDRQMKFYDRTLIKPYARAMQAITKDRIDLGRAFKSIKKEFKDVPDELKKKVPNSLFTKEQAVRIYIWDSLGKEVPGLNVEEVNELANYVADNKQLKDFADQVMRLNPGSRYLSPTDTWATGNITTDLLETLNTSRRAKHLGRWQQNVDEIFSTENLNKLEAAYGTKYRKAMENMLTRMKTGRNRTYGTDTQTAEWIEWMNGSVGAIMFLNNRSAILQTLSATNFINFGDNNIIAAGKAFANQKQYWTDFAKLINSDYLLERRDSLKINVNEADIAEAASKGGARGAINYILKLGFTPTKFADSFAIASGGAAFYRNRINALIKKGMDPVAAEKAAMRDFIEKSEESQQSSRPDKISQEQAGPLGRVILAFANTSAQYARITKKAASDLKNRRGSDKENISKILYYSVVQNLIFNGLQQAIFAVAFGDDEDLIDDKKLGVVNGMLDGIIRGTGIAGAVFSILKNTGLRIYKESEKKNPKYENAVFEAIKISPPISSKVSKLRSAGRTFSWDMKEIKAKGLDITSPAIGAGAQVVSATTNLPLDRVIRKIENLKAASDSELETYKRLALTLGWGKWELGIKDKKWKDPNTKSKSKSRVRKTKVRKVIKR